MSQSWPFGFFAGVMPRDHPLPSTNGRVQKRPRDLARYVGGFLQQYQRPRQRSHANTDPNDRHYDRKLERNLKRLDPETLDLLLNSDLEEQ